ncbi:hypothetical protein VP1G_09021 [Cytospora mali]|uniref:Major facilitator superfamily (MFS) profile domain-containing protein n=1 Tax=Cytospora mali TaxID=578113 RepID=A0A194VD94_CYTMA|nr:hypothetical protein VP1G_09021 [Valsa mali var. pyri (nom. inval.)]
MDEKDNKGLEAAGAKPEVIGNATDMSWSLTGSSSIDVDEKQRQNKDEKQDAGDAANPTNLQRPRVDNDDASMSSSDSADHGEPDLEHEDVEDIIPGHELDRQLSRVGSSKHVHKPRSVYDVESLRRYESRGSVKSKASRALSAVSGRIRSKKDGDGIRRNPLPETNLDEGIIGWDGQDDPNMPLNFPESRKWLLVALLSAITLVTPFASSILSPGITSLMVEFGETNEIVGSMTVSIYLLGYVVGPMFLAPLSEIYGRRLVLTVANIFFCLWQIGCALAPNISALIVFRFFSGVGGSGCLTLGGGVIGDLFQPEQRGFAMGMWTMGPLFGPTIGPLIGGFIAETIGWRWDFWIVLIVAVLISVMIEILNQETSHRVIIQRKVARLKVELGRDDLRSCYDTMQGTTPSQRHILLNGLVRPLKMLVLSPIVLLLSLYISFTYGTLYLLFTTIPTVFEETYGFNVGLTGLVYLGLGSGTTLGWIIITLYSDKSVIKLAKANNGEFEPEMRLAVSIFFSWLLPVTFFWYGWSAEYGVQWMSSILSLMPFGMGIMGLFLPITTYLVDCYPMYAASAIAANTELRSLVGALLPLAGPPMYSTLGLGWGNSLLGFLCLIMIPLPIIFYKFGKKLRKMEKFKL